MTITFKLTNTEAQALDQLVQQRRFRSRSDAVRAGLMMLFRESKIKAEALQQIADERYKCKPRKRTI